MLLSKKAHDFAHKILNLYKDDESVTKPDKSDKKDSNDTIQNNQNNNNTEFSNDNPVEYKKEDKRIVGGTDYKKYEAMTKELEVEEVSKDTKKDEALKMGCNNDLRKERQMMDKPSKDKIEASKIFKIEGDDFLKFKDFENALNSYEKGLLQLFYTFSNDEEEDRAVDTIKASINMNMSMCHMNLNKYDNAIGYCIEALRIDKNNLKAIYRVAYSYFKLDKFDDSRKYIADGFKLQPNMAEFKQLEESINKRQKELDDASRRLFKKILK